MDEDEQFEEGNLPIDIINSEEDKIPEPEARKEDGKTSQIILMKAQTWDRESHGLYDYESRRVQKFERKVENEGCMVRDKEDVRFWENHHPYDSQEETFLFKLVSKDNKFYVNPINDNPANDRLWLVIRSLRNGYTIQSHDILKLGRMKFKVKEFRSEHEYFEGEHVEKSPHQGFEELHEVQVAESDDIMCRFCWVGEQTEENPIIGSWRWAGSIKYIHFKCLKLWLESKVNKKNDTDCHSTMNWKNFEWELCKLPYPYTFMLNGKRWNLVDLKRPSDKDTPYIILESLNSEKNSSRTIHIVTINTEKTAFSLGRGHDSDLRINDISVSRKHANIEYRDGKFMFVDLKSKFGTLALLSDDVELELDNSQTFQIGRTVVTLKAKATQPWKNREKQSEFSLIKPDRSEFLQNTSNLIPSSNSPKSSGNSDDNKNPNCIPTFEANDRGQALEDRQQHIIEIDGKRYLVVQELDPAEENLPEI